MGGLIITFVSVIFPSSASINDFFGGFAIPQNYDFNLDDTIKDADLRFPIPQDNVNPTQNTNRSPLYGPDPSNISTEIVYDPETNDYLFLKKVGDNVIETPYPVSFEEYLDYDFDKAMKSYWNQRSKTDISETRETLIPTLAFGGEIFDRIFGSNTINIEPRGSADLTLGIKYTKTDRPGLSDRERKTTTFTFKETINMNVVGQIGEKMKVDIRHNTEAAFDFQNSVKLEYTGDEDEIIQKIEAGNVSLPLTGTLISGGQSLFGFKTELKFGRLTMTSIFSQKKSESSVINVEGGAQTKEFEINADEYEANKHYFLSHYFKENYDNALKILPVINSGINITKVEVWVTNRSGNFENSRNIVAFTDLGESNYNYIQSEYVKNSNGISTRTLPPSNEINNLNEVRDMPGVRDINSVGNTLIGLNMTGGVEYEKIESARLLQASEYTLNEQLGYISLNQALSNDQVLAVAFEYTVAGTPYKVGEFSNSAITAPQNLVLKLIKGTSFTPQSMTWSLMMRNVYYMRTYQMSSEDFWLDIMYTNDKTGTEINYLPVGMIKDTRLLSVLSLDNLNSQLDPYSDGVFDYIEGITVNSQQGRIIFPQREPFGSYLKGKITGGDLSLNNTADQYVFQELYDSTQNTARQIAEKNKFKLKGKYKSSGGSEIPLNAIDIPQGSVKVTAGAQELQENVDYIVDYNLGKVTILNQGIMEAGTPIQISMESNSMFSTITKTLMGAHLNYEFSKDLNVGATILRLTEKPLTTKVGIGEEPMSNTIWGVNASYRTDAPFLTKSIDFLPFIETKEMSTITMTGEFAHLIPGHSKAIKKEGNAYIDDFEGSKTTYDLKNPSGWYISSTPGDSVLFPEARLINNLEYGYNRAKLAWYYINSTFYTNSTPVSTDQLSNHYVRQIYEKEIFPNRENTNGNYPVVMNALNLAFYPNEKGPYNYDYRNIDENGFLTNQRNRWGGLMRRVPVQDFEDMNIEYIEFWLMDPFVHEEENQGGDLYLNLGDVSEDILKDGRKSFEQGLPTPNNNYTVDTSVWGLIPKIQEIVKGFDSQDGNQEAQDAGLDGLKDETERQFFSSYLEQIAARFGTGSVAYQKALEDPSSDNFHYFFGSDYDSESLGILERYKKYNGLENNSPSNSNESNRNSPDYEDINDDFTLSESENFFQYKVSIRKEDFEVGRNFITDKIEVNTRFENDEKTSVTWYQFRIPIYDYEKRIGTIRDFKSVRFMRMFLHDFSDPTILRFATLDLVRGEWRKYNSSLLQPGEYIIDEIDETPFDVGAVNIEENASKEPVNYILPPGIDREVSPMSPQLKQLNEQSMSLKVTNLQDGDARAVYKNVSLDIRKYNTLKMFVHAESVLNESELRDDDLSLFIRLGTDYKNNYYEYEIPLKVTPPGKYDNHSDINSETRKEVWPEANNLDLSLEKLQNIKQSRNNYLREGDTRIALTRLYSEMDGERKISIMGNPNLANVKTIMIGIKNPKKVSEGGSDDGLAKSGEIWVNELRLSDFDEKGGWAANARVAIKLADFGSLNIAGSTSKPGFGSINQKIGELQKEEINRYDISTNLELGKFFPEKFNVRIPLYMSISDNIVNPEYNPLDPDIPFRVALSDPALTQEYKDSIRKMGQERTTRKSLNFNNVKVNKTSGDSKIYDFANWSFSYGYNEIKQRDVNTEFNNNRTYTGSIFYNYNATPKVVEPFKNVELFKKKYFQILRDANFYYLPSQISFRTNMNRQYGETQLRNIYNPSENLPISVRKNFIWERQYDIKYNLSKGLKIEFTATNLARIDEPEGRMIKGSEDYDWMRDSIWEGIKDFGRNTNYVHQWDVTYNIPINKIPILNWISANARYSGTYEWTAGPFMNDTIKWELGNTIQNGNSISINPQVNLVTLYSKIKYLDQVNKKYRGRQPARAPKKEIETVTFEANNINLSRGKPKRINHGLKTEDITIKVTADGKDITGEMVLIDKNKASFTTEQDIDNAQIVVTGKREKTESIAKKILDNTLIIIMSVKNVSLNYQQTSGTLLPGYLPKNQILGLTNYESTYQAYNSKIVGNFITPTFPFILGWQDEHFDEWAISHNVVARDTANMQQFIQTHNQNWSGRASIEPFRDFKIDLNATYMHNRSNNEFLKYFENENTFSKLNDIESGSFSMSIISIGSSFESMSKGDLSSSTFEKFSEYRLEIAERLAKERAQKFGEIVEYGEDGFPLGYGKTSQDVMIPAFFAAYTNQDVEKVGLETIPKVFRALPNWRVTYDGLAKLNGVKKYFRTITLSHSYRSTYNIGNYQSRLSTEYEPEQGYNTQTNEIGDYFSRYQINGVSISEQFSPLFSIDATMINSLIAKFEIRKTRNINMSFTNNQATESKDNTYTIGTGYRFKDVEITIKSIRGGGQKTYKSDLNLRLDISYRENETVIRKLDEGLNQLTAGAKNFSLKTTADYVLNSRFTLRAYYNHILNKPRVSGQFNTTTLEFGFTLKFVLAS